MSIELPEWLTYPGDEWTAISPEEAGLDVAAWNRFLEDANVAGDGEWGAVLARGGYLVHTWGNPDYRRQTASLGKAFTWAVLGLATDAGLVRPDDLIRDTWAGDKDELQKENTCSNNQSARPAVRVA